MLRAVFAALLTATLGHAQDLKAPHSAQTPAEICRQLRGSASWIRPACVSIKTSGASCGTVISPEGLVVTAAHAIAGHDFSQPVQVSFDDGKQVQARVLGVNFDSDYALLRITTARQTPWPFVQLAECSPDPGTMGFILGHPGGKKIGRPAQLRLGRVTSLMRRDGHPWLMTADCEIQPGDSGAGLFALDGRLIGLASSAGNITGYNRFPGIEHLLRDRDRLERGERWGTVANGPSGGYGTTQNISRTNNAQLMQLFTIWTAEGHRPSRRLAQNNLNERGEVHVQEDAVISLQPAITFALARKESFSLGLDDPALVRHLPAIKAKAPLPVSVGVGKRRVAQAIPLNERLLLTKASELQQTTKPIVVQPGKANPISARIVARDVDFDLLLLQADEDLPPPYLSTAAMKYPNIGAGDLLFALDATGQSVWGIACDHSRPLDSIITTGPVQAPDMISLRPVPFPAAITHNLPLYALDGVTPVFNEQGQFAGIHVARLSRALGVMIPRDILALRLNLMKRQLPAPQKAPADPFAQR